MTDLAREQIEQAEALAHTHEQAELRDPIKARGKRHRAIHVTIRSLLTALADAQAAQAMVVERAAAKADRGHGTYCRARGRDPEKHVSAFYLMAREIRALAPIDGLALVRELRDRAEKAEADTRRLVVAATNPSGQKCNACRATGLTHCADPFNCGGMVDYKVDEAIETVENLLSAWKAARIERDTLAAANAVLEAKVAGLETLPPDYGHDGLRWKIGTAMRRSIDAAHPETDRDAALYHAFRAGVRAALATQEAGA